MGLPPAGLACAGEDLVFAGVRGYAARVAKPGQRDPSTRVLEAQA